MLPGSVSTSQRPRQQVARLARLCGLEALKNGGVKAYIRQADPFMTMPSKQVGLFSWCSAVSPAVPGSGHRPVLN